MKPSRPSKAAAGASTAPAVGPRCPTCPEADGYTQMLAGGTPSQIVEHQAGPILITAPHGLRVYRGGRAHGEKLRVHNREKHSTELALLLARALGEKLGVPCSFVVWNMKTAKQLDAGNKDPNYLLEADFDDDPWHVALRRWRDRCRAAGAPCLHLDFHGKMDRMKGASSTKRYALDLGMEPLLDCAAKPIATGANALAWTAAEAKGLRDALAAELSDALGDDFAAGPRCRRRGVKVDADPYLHGLWGHGCEHTLSHQSVRLGVPAFQFETPLSLRRELMADATAIDRMAAAIASVYRSVVVPVEATKAAAPGGRPVDLGAIQGIGSGAPDTDAIIDQMLADIEALDPKDTAPQI